MSNIKHLPTILTPAGLIDQIDFHELQSIVLVTQSKKGVIKALWSHQESEQLSFATMYLNAKVIDSINNLPIAPPENANDS
jgi:hypothetical protein